MSDRNRATLAALVTLFVVFGAGAYLAAATVVDGSVPLFPAGDRVAVVPVEGVITGASAERALRRLRRFERDESVRAYVLEIRSPGGTVGASQSLYREVRSRRAEDDRPVVAWIGDVGASGGYYVALAADSIYALPGSITGSIGVIMQFPDARELLRKAGVSVEIVRSGDHKGAGSAFRALDAEDRAVFETLVEDTYGQFLDAVVDARPVSRERATELADGRVFSGERAARHGLIDRVGTLSEAIDAAGRMAGLGEDPRTVRPGERRPGLLELVLGEGASEVRESVAGWVSTAGELSSPRLLYLWR